MNILYRLVTYPADKIYTIMKKDTLRVLKSNCYNSRVDGELCIMHEGKEKMVFNTGKRYYIYI